MDTLGFIKERVGLFKNFSVDRLKQLVGGSRVRSFEAKESVMHRGDEATHFAGSARISPDALREFEPGVAIEKAPQRWI
jgi:hypothetical protein